MGVTAGGQAVSQREKIEQREQWAQTAFIPHFNFRRGAGWGGGRLAARRGADKTIVDTGTEISLASSCIIYGPAVLSLLGEAKSIYSNGLQLSVTYFEAL